MRAGNVNENTMVAYKTTKASTVGVAVTERRGRTRIAGRAFRAHVMPSILPPSEGATESSAESQGVVAVVSRGDISRAGRTRQTPGATGAPHRTRVNFQAIQCRQSPRESRNAREWSPSSSGGRSAGPAAQGKLPVPPRPPHQTRINFQPAQHRRTPRESRSARSCRPEHG